MSLPVWKTTDPDFGPNFSSLRDRLSLGPGLRAADEPRGQRDRQSPLETVRRIIEDVRNRGDAAVLELTEKLDGCALTADRLRVPAEDLDAALGRCGPEVREALELAAERIRVFQRSIKLRDPVPLEMAGREVGIRYTPVDSVGIYVPGGTASLASTVLMAAVPARVAGVKRVAMATPPAPDGSVSDDRLAAARIAEVDEVYRIGGAQAVAALAWGTESIPPVDFIAGPGNIYVTLAKKEVFGRVGIEMLPGPSEIVVIADETADPEFVAADMLSQAEHNPGSAVLLTDCEDLAGRVPEALEARAASLPKADAARSCLEEYGAVVLARSLTECSELANRLAPEHLEIMTRDPEAVTDDVRHAGAIFLGRWTPEAVGDYVAGPSHILPTAGTARFSSGLSCNDFLKRSSMLRYGREALREDGPAIARLARAEDLEGHAQSVEARTEEPEE